MIARMRSTLAGKAKEPPAPPLASLSLETAVEDNDEEIIAMSLD